MNNLELELEYIEADSLLEGKYDRPLYNKFIEAYDVKYLQVLTPNLFVYI